MIIRIGDTIEDERGRQGELVNIGIATVSYTHLKLPTNA